LEAPAGGGGGTEDGAEESGADDDGDELGPDRVRVADIDVERGEHEGEECAAAEEAFDRAGVAGGVECAGWQNGEGEPAVDVGEILAGPLTSEEKVAGGGSQEAQDHGGGHVGSHEYDAFCAGGLGNGGDCRGGVVGNGDLVGGCAAFG